MGIECDGAAYHSAKSARDRDRLRQSVLEQLGWRIRRIWSVDWFRNAKLQLEPILLELAALRTEPAIEVDPEQAEEQIIQQVAEEQSQHAERISQEGGTSLREKLHYRISRSFAPPYPTYRTTAAYYAQPCSKRCWSSSRPTAASSSSGYRATCVREPTPLRAVHRRRAFSDR